MKKNAGFSLIELIITLAILAFTVSSALFIFQNQLIGNLGSDGQIIVDRLEDARSRAISGVNGSAWGIHFDNASSTPFYALFRGTTYSAASSTFFLSGLVQFSTPAANTTTDVVFGRLTGALSATSTIVISLKTNSTLKETITINPQGSVTAQ